MDVMSYRYTAYGLCVESSFPIPELTPATAGEPDLTVRYDDVPESLPFPSNHGAAWQSAPGRLLFSVEGAARYLIVENREIHIRPVPGCSEADVRTLLLGSVFAAVLHGRRMVVLHASAIDTARGAVLFMGHCGAGKSTLLAAFLRRGYRMLTDDKVRVMLDPSGAPQVLAGPRVLRLTHASARQLQYDVCEEALQHRLDKHVISVEPHRETPAPLAVAYALSADNQPEIRLEPLPPLDRFDALHRYIYRRRFVHDVEGRAAQFRILSAVATQCRVATVRRPIHPWHIDELCDRLEHDLAP